MEDHPARRSRLLEFAVASTCIGIASLFLLNELSQLQEEAERLTVESTVRNMNSGLFMRQAKLMVSGRERELPALVLENPVEWLESPPGGYDPATGCGDAGPAEAGHWCWDASARRLHYRPLRAGGLKVDGDVPILTWRVHASGDPSVVRPGSLRVVADRGYTWQSQRGGG